MHSEHPEYVHVFTYLAHPQSTSAVTPKVRIEIARRSGDNLRRIAALFDDEAGQDARLMADLMWASFAGLVVLRDSRLNLGAKPHPSKKELAKVLELLLAGIVPVRSSESRVQS